MSETNTKKRKKLIAAIIILAAIAAALAYVVYFKPAPRQSTSNASKNGQTQGTQAATGDPAKEVLKTPGPNATEEEKRKHAELVNKLAVEGSSVDISNCQANPVVLKVKQGSVITAKNSDDTDHVIGLNLKNTFTIPAKGEKKITANFYNGPGLYGYGCDDKPGVVGFFLVN